MTGISILDGLTIKAASLWLGYKMSKAMTHAMEALYKNDELFHNTYMALESTTAVLAQTTFDDLQLLRTRINGHDKDLDLLDNNFQHFLTMTNIILQNDHDTQQPSFGKPNSNKSFHNLQ